MVSNIL